MTCRKICIVIALMVLSISAIVGADQRILDVGRFSSTVNEVPVEVILAQHGSEPIKRMRARDLRTDWGDHLRKIVRFTGVVDSVEIGSLIDNPLNHSLWLRLEDEVTGVYPLDVPDLPETYERGHTYEFTGFLIRDERLAEFKKDAYPKNHVYAFQIRPVVFASPPMSAVQPEEASPAAPTAAAVKKSWEGPFVGFGLGLGLAQASAMYLGESEDSDIASVLPVQIRFGYGLSKSTVLYGSVFGARVLSGPASGEWGEPLGLLGVMVRGNWNRGDYWFSSLGGSLSDDPVRTIAFRGGYGHEVHPGFSLEGASTLEYLNYEGVSVFTFVLDVTFNYHFY